MSEERKAGSDLIAGLLVLLWVYTAESKLADFSNFKEQMNNQPLPLWLTNVLVYVIPLIELTMVVMLFYKRKYGLLLSVIVLLVFTFYVGLILFNAFSYVPCSCAGIFTHMSWKTHLYVNLALLLIAFLGFSMNRKRHILQPDDKK